MPAHQALSERKEVTELINENEEEMRLLQDLYIEHKELLDQDKLNEDLEQLHGSVGCPICLRSRSPKIENRPGR
jgi:predicted RNA-binding protein with EMAP domain